MKRKTKSIICRIMVLVGIISTTIVLTGLSACTGQGTEGTEFMRKLGAGINIGNDLDVVGRENKDTLKSIYDYETYWYNVPVTRKTIAAIKQSGFSTVRIPVSWGEHIDGQGRIDDEWMARVKEVVDWAMAEDLYVILNIHHEDWLVPSYSKETEVAAKFQLMWGQIAFQFKNYNQKLIFESMNEPRYRNSTIEWTGDDEARTVINHLNTLFVNTVRATGGNNSERWLLVTTYASAYYGDNLKKLEMPVDAHTAVSLHTYVPNEFARHPEKEDWSSNGVQYTNDINEMVSDIRSLCLDKGIPVVITEFGCMKRTHNDESRLLWLETICTAFRNEGIPYVWWDNGTGKYGLYNREDGTVKEPRIIEGIIKNH